MGYVAFSQVKSSKYFTLPAVNSSMWLVVTILDRTDLELLHPPSSTRSA